MSYLGKNKDDKSTGVEEWFSRVTVSAVSGFVAAYLLTRLRRKNESKE